MQMSQIVKLGLNSRDHSAAYKQMLRNLLLGQVIAFIPFMGKDNLFIKNAVYSAQMVSEL